MRSMDVEAIVQTIFCLFRRYGSMDYLGEPVTQTEHMVQCAMLAEQDGSPTQVILGALFHDIGHLVGVAQGRERMETDGLVLGVRQHDIVGQQFLEEHGIPRSVSVFTKGHVDAKRYLVYKDKTYYERLSNASKMTLEHQGGAMTAEEAALFEAEPQHDAILNMRHWDEMAKDPNVTIEPLEKYQEMCRQFLQLYAG